jgi:leucyl/phenylalanyl-tRNA--protein transferase
MTFGRLFPGGPFVLGPEPVFPDPAKADRDGLLAVGGDLSPERLLAAYRAGIFPWFSEDEPILWWSPDPRASLAPSEVHISRSLAKVLRQRRFEVRADTAFGEVIRACAHAERPGQHGTWITPAMVEAYERLHALGVAHSVEAWREGRLVGGLYGLAIGGVFFGESMFSRERDASKAVFASLCRALEAAGFGLVDCQVENPHTASLGAQPGPRKAFLGRLAQALESSASWRKVQQGLCPA